MAASSWFAPLASIEVPVLKSNHGEHKLTEKITSSIGRNAYFNQIWSR
jgi:hypothetical protein